jgi:DNA-directed RNA polymerase specialized sigma24 family protein
LLEELCKKDAKWREISFKICKDRMLADDIVQDMYIKLADNKKQINDFYVIIVIRNIFLDHIKKEKLKVSIDKFYNLESGNNTFEIDDEQKKLIENLYWVAKDYFVMSFDMSLRQMAKELNTNYGFIYRTMKKEKDKIKNKLCQKKGKK